MSVQPNDVHSKQLKHWGDKAPMLKSLRRKEKSINKALDKKKGKTISLGVPLKRKKGESDWMYSERQSMERDKHIGWAD